MVKTTPAERVVPAPYPSHAESLEPNRSQQSRIWRALQEDVAVVACETSDLHHLQTR